MKQKSTTYRCDGHNCPEKVTIPVTAILGHGALDDGDWVVLESGKCYCTVKCFLTKHKDKDGEE